MDSNTFAMNVKNKVEGALLGRGSYEQAIKEICVDLFNLDRTGPTANCALSKGYYDIYLDQVGCNKINVIKAIRQITTLGLKEAKDITDTLGLVKSSVYYDDLGANLKTLRDAGATVSLQKHNA